MSDDEDVHWPGQSEEQTNKEPATLNEEAEADDFFAEEEEQEEEAVANKETALDASGSSGNSVHVRKASAAPTTASRPQPANIGDAATIGQARPETSDSVFDLSNSHSHRPSTIVANGRRRSSRVFPHVKASVASFGVGEVDLTPVHLREDESEGDTEDLSKSVRTLGGMIPRPSSAYYDGPGGGGGDEAEVDGKPVKYETEGSANCCTKFLRKITHSITSGMESFFYHYGRIVSKKPGVFIALCVIITVASTSGFIYFRKENTNTKLWVPQDASSSRNLDWLWEHYPPDVRFSMIIFEDEQNVLRPEVIQAMYRLHKRIASIETSRLKVTLTDVCLKIPVFKPPDLQDLLFGKKKRKRRKRQSDSEESYFDLESDEFFAEDEEDLLFKSDQDIFGRDSTESEMISMAEEYSVSQYPSPYCEISESAMHKACFERSILELWANNGQYDEATDEAIENLTLEEVLDKINQVNSSGIFLREFNFTSLLSGIKRDPSTGNIVSAKASAIRYFLRMNATAAKFEPVKNRAEPIEEKIYHFEGEMVKAMLDTKDYPAGLKSYPNVKRSFGDIGGSTILGDASLLGIGYMVVFVYVMLMLGKFNCLEQRFYLSLCGILGVVSGIIVSYGACSAMGLFFGPLHNVLPFLMLGIGIDDMFVIVQCFNTLSEEEQELSITKKMGKTMQRAGVAITITSLTDIIAFGIGGSTVLPALRSFCLYASVGIIAIYFFQCTFFVACMSIDQRRIEMRRNGCCPCFKHSSSYAPNKLSQISVLESFFKGYAKVLTTWPFTVIVILATFSLLGVGIWGNVLLKQKFDPTWFIPQDTYLAQFFVKNKQYFPFRGDRVTVYLYDLNYTEGDYQALATLVNEVANQTDIVDEVESWTEALDKYMNNHFIPVNDEGDKYPWRGFDNSTYFSERLGQFLFSPAGGKFRESFEFDNNSLLQCGKPAPTLKLAHFTFTHKIFSGPEEHIPAMNRIKAIMHAANAKFHSGKVFPLSMLYPLWETDEVIAQELYKNLGLAMLCIFISTLFLLADFGSSVLVLICVIMSLVDVAGLMHFWGLTIDTVSCVNLIIAIGLCVDYSAHIAHRFMTEQGSRRERIHATLSSIGPAVLNGGFSTFLAFILLATSKSHVFSTFFKIFFLVVTLGLFHGLVFLPVILRLIGPSAHSIDVSLSEAFAPSEGQGLRIAPSLEDTTNGTAAARRPEEGRTDPNTYKV